MPKQDSPQRDLQKLTVTKVEHFRHIEEAHNFIDKMINKNYAFSMIKSPLGFFVSVIEFSND